VWLLTFSVFPTRFAKLGIMPSLTLDLSEQLQDRVKPFSRWLPAILEVSLLNLKSPAHQAASDFIEFLVSNPSEHSVGTYRLAEGTQGRVEQLLEKNRQGTLSEDETKELDDYFKLEHVVRVMKAKLKTKTLV
jgi:hypothetical protein